MNNNIDSRIKRKRSSKQFPKLLLKVSLILLLLIIGGGMGFVVEHIQKGLLTKPITNAEVSAVVPTVTQTPTPTITPTPAPVTVSYAVVNGKILLQYGGKFYDTDKGITDLETMTLNNSSSYQWTKLVDRPTSVDKYDTSFDNVFSFKVSPDNKSFVFVMNWRTMHGNNSKPNYEVFYYSISTRKLSNLLSYTEDSVKERLVPKIDQISNDGNYVSFNMFSCWGCDGHHPETLLFNITNNRWKRIGDVFEFAWGDTGKYTYKEYKVITCPPDIYVRQCTEDPKTLPVLNGQF